jgi:hypothetical protein
MRRSKTAEVTINLNNMFKLGAAYYDSPRVERGVAINAVGSNNCVVPTTVTREPANPNATKQQFVETTHPEFVALGFTISDLVYYSYGLVSQSLGASPNCLLSTEVPPIPGTAVYTFYSNGDIDDDGTEATFEVAVAVDGNLQLSRAVGFYINNETE